MRSRVRGESGTTSIQIAILMPAVLLWLMLLVQYGLWWHAKQVANAAASEAVEAAQTSGSTGDDGRAAAIRYLAAAGNLRNIEIRVDRGTVVVAEVRGDAPRLVPGFDWTVRARNSAPVERFIPEAER